MYKRLRVYYLYTALPFLLLLSAAVVYREAIAKTITTNPHPQINYLIFAITLVGGILILLSIKKLMHEVRELSLFTRAKRDGATPKELQEIALECDADIAYVLRMIAASSNRAISQQEQIALENELHKASTRLSSRNALPQFLSGLLVGLGLLGTFIGLLSTLSDIAALITSFGSLDMATADPIAVFGEMVDRMEAPMHSMGIAFSASMYGLLGSLVLSFMMVSVRRFLNEIITILGSEIAQHIEFALARSGFAYSKAGLKLDVSKTAAIEQESDTSSGQISDFSESNTVVSGEAETEIEGTVSSSPVLKSAPRTDEVRILYRIEERMAESAKMQERAMNAEVKDFQNQRAEMLRTLAESSEASNNFRSELQRVGRQLGSLLTMMEDNSAAVSEQMVEIKVSMADDANEMQRLMGILIEETRKR